MHWAMVRRAGREPPDRRSGLDVRDAGRDWTTNREVQGIDPKGKIKANNIFKNT